MFIFKRVFTSIKLISILQNFWTAFDMLCHTVGHIFTVLLLLIYSTVFWRKTKQFSKLIFIKDKLGITINTEFLVPVPK